MLISLIDMDSLPTLTTLQKALLNDESCEEELLSVLHHLLICAIDDPGIPPGIKVIHNFKYENVYNTFNN